MGDATKSTLTFAQTRAYAKHYVAGGLTTTNSNTASPALQKKQFRFMFPFTICSETYINEDKGC